MDTFTNMDMEMKIGDNPFEEDVFLPITGEFLENPFNKETEGAVGLPVQEADVETGNPANLSEEGACLEEDGAEKNADLEAEETEEQEETNAESSGTEKELEDKKRAEHEAAEARRKAEWEARQKAKKEAEQAQLARMSSLSDEEVTAEAMKRVGTDTERLTRRNMKECVSEYIQTLCLEDPAFARLTMHPRKTMIHCFHYINRKAREFVEQEMKDNDIKPENGVYGSDVPDDLCYQWAEEYFRDPDAKEDWQEEEKFVPKAYSGKSSVKSKRAAASVKKGTRKEKSGKKGEKKTQEKVADSGQFQQMTLAGLAG